MNKISIITLLVAIGVYLFSPLALAVRAQGLDTIEGEVIEVLEEKQIETSIGAQPYQKLQVKLTSGSQKDQKIIIEHGQIPSATTQLYHIGDDVVISVSQDINGQNHYVIADFVRRDVLLFLFIIFVVVTVVIGQLKGLTSLLGMIFSFGIIFSFILPQIMHGANPVVIAIVASIALVPITFFLSHGINQKTLIAIASTFVALLITGILATIFIDAAKLTGFASEEAAFLQVAAGGTIPIKGLLLAGIIIGCLGILDDITVSQAAVVAQLKQVNAKLSPWQLYRQAMVVGQDHIASMVNTLILVYTGAALPLLLLFTTNPQPFAQVINYELLADEIIRTLVGSIGLILAVPITTFLAVNIAFSKRR
ncbi:YibE/F family protein [Candidatus Beckwithbacteria bacterium]|nr:YibE/F family protein [Candidatus Beckwithbacteria bacterium]